ARRAVVRGAAHLSGDAARRPLFHAAVAALTATLVYFLFETPLVWPEAGSLAMMGLALVTRAGCLDRGRAGGAGPAPAGAGPDLDRLRARRRAAAPAPGRDHRRARGRAVRRRARAPRPHGAGRRAARPGRRALPLAARVPGAAGGDPLGA